MRSLQPPTRVTHEAIAFSPVPAGTDLARWLTLRRSMVVVGLHRLTLTERILGLPWRRRVYCWEDLLGVEVEGTSLALIGAEGRRIATFVRGDPGQLAWIASHIGERLRAATLAATEVQAIEADQQQLRAIARLAKRSEVA